MALMDLTAAYIAVNSVTYHDHCSKIELTVEVEDKDVTTYASQGWKEHLGGLKSGTLALTLKQDIAAGNVDATFWALLGSVTSFEVRLTQSSRSSANPGYLGNILVTGWKPISGSVGDVAEVDESFPTSGIITRSTS